MESSQDYYFSPFFKYKNGLLHCEGKSVRDIQTWLSNRQIIPHSPVFVYSKNKLIENVKGYMAALNRSGKNFQLNYSLKANRNPHILKVIKDLGCSVTLVSGMELQLALKLGFQPSTLVLNGNGKQDWEVEHAVTHGCLLNIDSHFNLRQTIRACEKLERNAKVLLRINPDIDPNVHQYISTGKSASKFGLDPEELDDILCKIKQQERLQLVGIHCHLGSTIETSSVFRKSAEIMIHLFRRLKSEGFKDMQYLNLGGGLSVPYRRHAWRTTAWKDGKNQPFTQNGTSTDNIYNNEEHIRWEQKQSQMNDQDLDSLKIADPSDVVSEIAEVIKNDDVTLIIEPGRSLVADAGILVTTVIGVKTNGKKKYNKVPPQTLFVIASFKIICTDSTESMFSKLRSAGLNYHLPKLVDGAMTEVIRPALYDAYHHIDLAEPTQSVDGEQLFTVVGPVCESADFLGKERYLATPHEGCLLTIFDVGAYCASMGSNYNMRACPAEVLVDGQTCELIRRPDSFESIMVPYYSAGSKTIDRIFKSQDEDDNQELKE